MWSGQRSRRLAAVNSTRQKKAASLPSIENDGCSLLKLTLVNVASCSLSLDELPIAVGKLAAQMKRL
jgi:hypothetical protein